MIAWEQNPWIRTKFKRRFRNPSGSCGSAGCAESRRSCTPGSQRRTLQKEETYQLEHRSKGNFEISYAGPRWRSATGFAGACSGWPWSTSWRRRAARTAKSCASRCRAPWPAHRIRDPWRKIVSGDGLASLKTGAVKRQKNNRHKGKLHNQNATRKM